VPPGAVLTRDGRVERCETLGGDRSRNRCSNDRLPLEGGRGVPERAREETAPACAFRAGVADMPLLATASAAAAASRTNEACISTSIRTSPLPRGGFTTS